MVENCKSNSSHNIFCEMNVRVGDLKPTACPQKLLEDPITIKQMQECALSAINDGYTVIVYNFLREGTSLNVSDTCNFKGFPDLEQLWLANEQKNLSKSSNLFKPDFSKIKQLTRLTMCFDNSAYIHQCVNMSTKPSDKSTLVINSYDLVAVKPSTQNEQVFEQTCTKSDVDLITVDCSARFQFYIQKTWVKQAVERGIQFELTYGSSCLEAGVQNRKMFLSNSLNLIKLCKGKNLILSSEANNIMYQRSPVDCQIMCESIFGMKNAQDRLAVVRANCLNAIKHSHLRKTYKGVAEIVIAQDDKENNQEQKNEVMNDD